MFVSDTPKTQVLTIEPAMAESLLARNSNNRNVSGRNLEKIKSAIIRGEWSYNGEAVKIGKTGRVLDGQHRLMACVETGVPIETLVVYGLEDSTQDTMDTGKSRSAANVLAIHGYTDVNNLSAVVNTLITLEKRDIRTAVAGGGQHPNTSREVLDRLDREPEIEGILKVVGGLRKMGMGARVVAALYYVFTGIDEDDAEFFFDRLKTGESMGRGNPILALRSQLITLRGKNAQPSRVYVAALTIKAWNKYREGLEATALRFTPGGANPERFPEPI